MFGICVVSFGCEWVVFDLLMKDELIGNFVQGIFYGGVIFSLFDVIGGVMVLIGVFEWYCELLGYECMVWLLKFGIIDLCVDYLCLGCGWMFIVYVVLFCLGNKVVVVCLELYSDDGMLVVVGIGIYLCG